MRGTKQSLQLFLKNGLSLAQTQRSPTVLRCVCTNASSLRSYSSSTYQTLYVPETIRSQRYKASKLAASRSRAYDKTFSTSSCHLNVAARENAASETDSIYNHPNHRPLDGVLVIALEQVISGPYCTRQLADLGARVIKIERPGTGDFVRYHDKRVLGEMCSHFVWTNRNKESLALDIKKPEDLKILKELIKKADVFVQNLVPGAAARMGLSFEELKKTNDRLIMCEISGYGSDGPYKTKKAYDLLVQSEAGLLSITGTPEEPSKVGASIADIAAGMYAYSSIMAALLQRQKTGKGCRLDVSMLESMVEWMGYPMYYAYEGQSAPSRAGASHASIYPYGPFQARDSNVMIGLQNEREWGILCEKVLDMPELEKDDRFTNNTLRSHNRQELYEIICDKFRTMAAEEVIKKLENAGIANAKLNNMKDVWEHPQLEARKRFREVKTEAGVVKTSIPPGMAGNVQPRLEPVPVIGEHNDLILAEFGLRSEASKSSIE